jgi:hypothetical protein
VRWLFTSKKSGQVMKRRLDHTNHLNIKVHKHRHIPAWWIVQSALCIVVVRGSGNPLPTLYPPYTSFYHGGMSVRWSATLTVPFRYHVRASGGSGSLT